MGRGRFSIGCVVKERERVKGHARVLVVQQFLHHFVCILLQGRYGGGGSMIERWGGRDAMRSRRERMKCRKKKEIRNKSIFYQQIENKYITVNNIYYSFINNNQQQS